MIKNNYFLNINIDTPFFPLNYYNLFDYHVPVNLIDINTIKFQN